MKHCSIVIGDVGEVFMVCGELVVYVKLEFFLHLLAQTVTYISSIGKSNSILYQSNCLFYKFDACFYYSLEDNETKKDCLSHKCPSIFSLLQFMKLNCSISE